MPLWRHWSESRFVPLPQGADEATRKLQVLELQMALADAFGTPVRWPDQGDDVVDEAVDDGDVRALRELARTHGGSAKHAYVVDHLSPPSLFLPCPLREPVVGKKVTIGSCKQLIVELRALTDLVGESTKAPAKKDASSRLEASARARAERAWAVLLNAALEADEKQLPVILVAS